MSVSQWVGKVAVVTGASAGIGAAIALTLAKAGLIVVGVARRVDRVEALKAQLGEDSKNLVARQADISKEEDIKELFQWIRSAYGSIHVLINNAAVTRYGKIIHQNPQYWRDIFDTNVIGLTICTQEAVKLMTETNVDGQIILVNSTLGHVVPTVPDSHFGIYPASKFAVTAINEIIRQELRSVRSKIKVTSLSPGMVDTELGDASNAAQQPHEQIDRRSLGYTMLASQDLADAVMYILSTPPSVQVHELHLKPVGSFS